MVLDVLKSLWTKEQTYDTSLIGRVTADVQNPLLSDAKKLACLNAIENMVNIHNATGDKALTSYMGHISYVLDYLYYEDQSPSIKEQAHAIWNKIDPDLREYCASNENFELDADESFNDKDGLGAEDTVPDLAPRIANG